MEAYLRRSSVVLLLIVSFIAALVMPSPSPVVGDKVKLNLYYESLCPFCQNFILNDLPKIYDNGLIDIIDLKLSPYGNAKLLDNGTIVCQHGKQECKLNTVEACAINAWPAIDEHLRFITCVESFADQGKHHDKWKTCFQKLKLGPEDVNDCINSGLGYMLELQYADEIGALRPPHRYVPWVTVNGQPLLEDYEKFTSYVCKAYKGPNVPRACHGLSLSTSTAPDSSAVCYKENYSAKANSKLL
ncbi:gamma-interferon-responsive lysosomal thiol protein-like [Bidens hawaiensis]|uniref:gamma-interferon-responsive lysosomal thiol protein-like n=1 Tax=Bidens hawaiensis TaxID=980011 RepID=UPI004049B3C4